jgi:hypothetical protein
VIDNVALEQNRTPVTPSPEFTLAAACCRLPGPGRDEAVRAAAVDIDWRSFEAVVDRHRVAGLANDALSAAGVTVESATWERLRRVAGTLALRSLQMAAETARLQRALDAAGVANLVLKGATLDLLAWGRLGLKQSWDIDLLVTPDQAAEGRKVLETAGYKLADPADAPPAAFEMWTALSKESAFVHSLTGTIVELHWRLTDAATLLPGIDANSPSQTLGLSDSLTLRTLGEEELFAYLCVHGASHAWYRLKWLADVTALWERRDEAGRVALYRRAVELGAGRCPSVLVRLLNLLLFFPLPPALASEVAGDVRAHWLAELAIDAMAGKGGAVEVRDRPFFSERILLSNFLFADGKDFWSREWRRQFVSVDDHMRLQLPPHLRFLYGPVRAPLWIWRRLRRRFMRP